jgi:hypothetical protein
MSPVPRARHRHRRRDHLRRIQHPQVSRLGSTRFNGESPTPCGNTQKADLLPSLARIRKNPHPSPSQYQPLDRPPPGGNQHLPLLSSLRIPIPFNHHRQRGLYRDSTLKQANLPLRLDQQLPVMNMEFDTSISSELMFLIQIPATPLPPGKGMLDSWSHVSLWV